jgi:hypothetical protein
MFNFGGQETSGVGDTIIHVTVAPMPAVLEKCRRNLNAGFRANLLVPDDRLQAARQMAATLDLSELVGVLSLEGFVGQNIEEMGEFSKASVAAHLRRVLETYNERVEAVETNRALLIEIPANL